VNSVEMKESFVEKINNDSSIWILERENGFPEAGTFPTVTEADGKLLSTRRFIGFIQITHKERELLDSKVLFLFFID
jgi:hypothetical protein